MSILLFFCSLLSLAGTSNKPITTVGATSRLRIAKAEGMNVGYTCGERSRTKGEITNKPADFWWVFFTGVGNLSDWVVSNIVQGGLFPRPPDEGPFDATFEQWRRVYDAYSTYGVGLTGEYPAGSGQFYTYAAGPWIGALYPVVDSIGDTTWISNVSKGAYYSDMGGMSIPELENAGEVGDVSGRGITFSDQIIPFEYGYPHEGENVFKQPDMALEDYQVLWPFADTSLNSKRPLDMQLNPANGDIVSNQDTYAVAGDWISEADATCIWIRDTGKYDVWGLGIRVEQRTYSFNMPENEEYIYINYKIRNMNSFPLKNVYFGYFMDNDVGQGTGSGQGCEDDLIGYDKALNLGYTYDSDGYEPDWTIPPGYIGCVLCETPEDIGFTGFASWMLQGPDSLVDLDGQDSLKYKKLMDTVFCICDSSCDVRHLSSSGPYPIFQPDEEVDFTIAVVCGATLDELKKNAQNAITQFNNGYIPQSPIVKRINVVPTVVSPGDSITITAWVYDPDNLQEVRADIESPDESLYVSLQLYDDGFHNDSLADDHIYGNIWETPYKGKTYFIDLFAKDNLGNTTLVNNGAAFTTLGPLVIENWEITDADTIPSPGDSVNIKIEVKNKGISPIYGVTGELIADYIEICDSIQSFGDIDSGAIVDRSYKIKIRENAPDTIISILLNLVDSTTGQWEDTIALKITDDIGPFLHYPEVIPTFLSAGSTVIIRGKLIDGSGINWAEATIESPIGTPITTITLYDDGTHSDSLAGDKIYGNFWTTSTGEERFYNVNLTARDNLSNEREYLNLMEFTTKVFSKTTDILVVDDDNYNRPPLGPVKPYETYYTDALDANGYEYDIWDVFCYGSPDTSVLNRYSIVVWLTGTTYDSVTWEPEYYNSEALTIQEQEDLKHYLAEKGRLFLSSQGISEVGNFSNFLGFSYKIVTGVDADTIIGVSGNPIGNGLEFAISGGTGANNQFVQSALVPTGSPVYGDSIFSYKNYEGEGYAGIMCDSLAWAAVTFPFGFEAIDSDEMRNEVMHRVIEWLYSTGIEDNVDKIPLKYELLPNYPNPFKSITEIRYAIPKKSYVNLSIYNIVGQKVITLVDKYEAPGYKKIRWNRKKFPAGIYFYRLKAGNYTETKKMVVME